MSDPQPQFTSIELKDWQQSLEEADRHNVFCYCRACDHEWVASKPEACICGSKSVEHIACWQFSGG